MKEESGRGQNEKNSELREWVVSIVIAVVLAFVIKIFLFDFVLVDGSSMHPTLENGERLFMNKIEYRIGEPERGDIVILNYSEGVEYVKRVVAKGGDTISIEDQVVYLNGEPLSEPYISAEPYGDFAEVTVPENEYFVMGDNRANSSDSRFQSLGFVEKDAIVGHVIFRLWPLNRIGALH